MRPEPLPYTACVSNIAIEDFSGDSLLNWVLAKVKRGYRNAINAAILFGDGVSKPQGLFGPHGGVPICETSATTPPGQFDWRDLVMLQMEIPLAWQVFMNQRTYAFIAHSLMKNGARIEPDTDVVPTMIAYKQTLVETAARAKMASVNEQRAMIGLPAFVAS